MLISFLKTCLLSFLLLVLFDSKVKAEPFVNVNFSLGVGLRYSVFTFPFPSVNFNRNIGKGIAFFEGSLSPVIIMGNIGYEYPITQHNAFYLAVIKGGTIGSLISGYKIAYVYYSNKVNKRGWVTTLELYRVKESYLYINNIAASDGYNGMNEATSQVGVFPSISFGYQW